jgi:hypothetical protein
MPILHEFHAMHCGPFQNQRMGAAGQYAPDQFKCFDCIDSLKFAVLDVKVGRRMVIPVHPDQDAIEHADGRH